MKFRHLFGTKFGMVFVGCMNKTCPAGNTSTHCFAPSRVGKLFFKMSSFRRHSPHINRVDTRLALRSWILYQPWLWIIDRGQFLGNALQQQTHVFPVFYLTDESGQAQNQLYHLATKNIVFNSNFCNVLCQIKLRLSKANLIHFELISTCRLSWDLEVFRLEWFWCWAVTAAAKSPTLLFKVWLQDSYQGFYASKPVRVDRNLKWHCDIDQILLTV